MKPASARLGIAYLLPQGNQTAESIGRRCRDGCSSGAVVKRYEIAPESISDMDPDFSANEKSTHIIPDAVRVAVEVAIETTVGDQAHVERR